MKNYWLLLCCCGLLTIVACEKKLTEIDRIDDLACRTGVLDTETMTITGEILSVGEGIVAYGHVWGTNNNPVITNPANNVEDHGALDQPASFTSEIDGLVPGVENFIRAFATDRFGFTHYGEVDSHTPPDGDPCEALVADFVINNDNCPAACTVVLENESRNANRFIWTVDGVVSAPTITADTSIRFTAPGTYSVTLTAISDAPDCRKSVTKQVTIVGASLDTTYTQFSVGVKAMVTPAGYTIVGNTLQAGVGSSVFFLQINKQGRVVNSVTTALELSVEDAAEDAVLLTNGNYVIVGSTLSADTTPDKDYYYVQTDATGRPTTGPQAIEITEGADVAYAVIQDMDPGDGNVVLAGTADETGQPQIHVLKTRPNRSSESFSHTISTGNQFDFAFDIVELAGAGNGYALAGLSQINAGGPFQGAYTRLSETGMLVSGPTVYSIYGEGEFRRIGRLNNDYFLTGQTTANTGTGEIAVAQVDAAGSRAAMPFDPAYSEGQQGLDILPLSDGSLIIVGSASDDALLMKINANGMLAWSRTFGASGPDFFRSVALTDDGGFIATGSKDGALYIVKTDDQGLTTQ